MSLKKEEFQALIEREGVMDFIWARSYKEISGIGLYEMANDRIGAVFLISPPVFVNESVQKELIAQFNGLELPDKSSIQFFSFASRNITDFKNAHKFVHDPKAFSSVHHKDGLAEFVKNQEQWLKKHSNESIFGNKLDYRVRNFINLVTITIPKYDKHGVEFSPNQLVSFINRFKSQFSYFHPINCDQKKYVTIMRELLIPDAPLWRPPKDTANFINYQVVDHDSVITIEDDFGALGIGKMVSKEIFEEREAESIQIAQKHKGFFARLFESNSEEERIAHTTWYAKMLTTKMFPEAISIMDMASIISDYFGDRDAPLIPSPFFLSLIIYFEGRDKVREEVKAKANWNIWQTQNLGKAAKFFPKIVERAKEAEAINSILAEGATVAYASLAACIMDDNLQKLEKYTETFKNNFLNRKNWVWQEEVLIPHWIFLYHLPMNFEPVVLKDLAKRMNTVFTANMATITPLTTGFKGHGMPVLSYVDRNGQICGFDIFSSESNYNAIVIGASGSGKSYAMSDLFMNYLTAGTKIRVIDVGKSYKSLCEFVGGKYISFDQSSSPCFNFFTNIKTEKDPVTGRTKIDKNEMEFIVPLIGLMAMQPLIPEDAEGTSVSALYGKIEKAVIMAFDMRQQNAGMQEVLQALQRMQDEYKAENNKAIDKDLDDLINALYPFGDPDGEYFSYFNGPNNVSFEDNDFVVFEMEDLESKGQLKPVALASLTYMINKEFFLGDRSIKKIMAIDEAWSLLSDKIVARYIDKSARRIRKHKGSLIIITQSIKDVIDNQGSASILANSTWRLFLQQTPESIAQAERNENLSINRGVAMLMNTIRKKAGLYSEMMIEKAGESFNIVRIIPNRVAHWIYTTDEEELRLVKSFAKEKGISLLDAKLIRGYAEENGTTIEEEYIKRLQKGMLRYNLEKDQKDDNDEKSDF